MEESICVAVDVMGGDKAPDVVLAGIEAALQEDPSLYILAAGQKDNISTFCESHDRCSALFTTEVIGMAEHPTKAIRKKKDSSLVQCCYAVKEQKAQAFFSAGSTGACLAGATLIIGRIRSIRRPALATVVPSPVKDVILCDVGANADCKPEYLVQFAKMGQIYSQKILHTTSPSIGLLNIGEEEEKGSMFAQEAHQLLKEHVLGFKGNAEGRDVLSGMFDIIVCDGFSGNICLKSMEGTASILFKEIKDSIKSSKKSMLGGLLIKDSLKGLAKKMNPDRFGGAPLLGINGGCIVGHGSSNERAIKNGILAASSYARSGIIDDIKNNI